MCREIRVNLRKEKASIAEYLASRAVAGETQVLQIDKTLIVQTDERHYTNRLHTNYAYGRYQIIQIIETDLYK